MVWACVPTGRMRTWLSVHVGRMGGGVIVFVSYIEETFGPNCVFLIAAKAELWPLLLLLGAFSCLVWSLSGVKLTNANGHLFSAQAVFRPPSPLWPSAPLFLPLP